MAILASIILVLPCSAGTGSHVRSSSTLYSGDRDEDGATMCAASKTKTFWLTTDSTGPLRTHRQTPLWAKYMILVARKGTLQCGSCVLTDIYIQSSRSGSFFCVLSRTCPKTREFFNTASRLIGNGFVPRQSSRKKMGFGAIDCVMHRTALVLSNH